jgi:hypothetical protein
MWRHNMFLILECCHGKYLLEQSNGGLIVRNDRARYIKTFSYTFLIDLNLLKFRL